MDEYIQGLQTAYVDKEICEPSTTLSSLEASILCLYWLLSRENPYRPMKLYTEDLQKSTEEVNAEFEDLISSLMGPFWSAAREKSPPYINHPVIHNLMLDPVYPVYPVDLFSSKDLEHFPQIAPWNFQRGHIERQ